MFAVYLLNCGGLAHDGTGSWCKRLCLLGLIRLTWGQNIYSSGDLTPKPTRAALSTDTPAEYLTYRHGASQLPSQSLLADEHSTSLETATGYSDVLTGPVMKPKTARLSQRRRGCLCACVYRGELQFVPFLENVAHWVQPALLTDGALQTIALRQLEVLPGLFEGSLTVGHYADNSIRH